LRNTITPAPFATTTMATAAAQVRPPCARAAAVSPAVRILTGGARCEQEPTDLERFRAAPPVAGLIASLEDVDVPHELEIGTRLQKKGSKKLKDHGIVVHIMKDASMITVQWMRGQAIQPTTYYTPEDTEWNKLVNWRDAFRDAENNAGERGIPQQATFEILKNCWCAPFPLSPAAAALQESAVPRRGRVSPFRGRGLCLVRGGRSSIAAAAAAPPSAPWASELSCGGDSSTADRATSSRWMQTPLGLLCAEANVSYGSVAQRREAE
jgi:hypothetical protein